MGVDEGKPKRLRTGQGTRFFIVNLWGVVRRVEGGWPKDEKEKREEKNDLRFAGTWNELLRGEGRQKKNRKLPL